MPEESDPLALSCDREPGQGSCLWSGCNLKFQDRRAEKERKLALMDRGYSDMLSSVGAIFALKAEKCRSQAHLGEVEAGNAAAPTVHGNQHEDDNGDRGQQCSPATAHSSIWAKCSRALLVCVVRAHAALAAEGEKRGTSSVARTKS